jgi:hypothetical protein
MVIADHVKRMASGIGGTKPSALSPFLFHLYTAVGCLDEGEWGYYRAAQVEDAYGFEASDEEGKEAESEEPGTTGAGPSEPTPPEQVTPEPKKTKRKTTPKSTGGVRKIRKNAKGEDCGFDLCAQTVEDIQGLTTLMTDRLAMAKEGYEYLLDVIHSALKAAGGIEVHELVEYIEQHSQSGSNRKLEEWIQELEQDLREEKP